MNTDSGDRFRGGRGRSVIKRRVACNTLSLVSHHQQQQQQQQLFIVSSSSLAALSLRCTRSL